MKRKVQLLAVAIGTAMLLTGVAVAASSPTVVTGSASNIGSTSAILHGSVNPNGGDTVYQFQWGLTTAYGLANATHSAGRGTKAVSVQTTAAGLIPGTVYHYRLVALSKDGATIGSDRTFRTGGHAPPGVVTGPPGVVGPTSATLTGTVNPNGEATTWVFQYGLTPAYGLQTFGGTVSAAGPAAVSELVQGLSPGTLFHYRLVALHGASVVSYGGDQTFLTYPSPPPRPQVRATTVPGRARSKPYVFTTYATVIGPASIPQSLACGQGANATIHYFFGRRQVGYSLAPVQPNCTLSSQFVFTHKFGRGRHHPPEHLRILIHFRGNGYLAPADARPETVTIG